MGCFECLKLKGKRGKISHNSLRQKNMNHPDMNSKPPGLKYINRKTSASLTSFQGIDQNSNRVNCTSSDRSFRSSTPLTNHFQASSSRASSASDRVSSTTGRNDPENKSVHMEMLNAGALGSMFGSVSSTELLATVADDSKAVDADIYRNFEFPFTNLILEGGGNKGMAYVGALRVLEEAGITHKIKRIAGSSVGAITAALLAVGFTSSELQEFMNADLRHVLVDHRCGYLSLLPNLLSGFGWNPGKRLYKWFGDQLKERTGNGDITFRQVYETYGRELCIVVTNLSQMSTEYFHPKTTPNTPIRTAVRMSAALPGIFQSVRYRLNEDTSDVFVDGGLLCNYPIHAFDGWWLSMDPKDSFFKKLQPLENYAKLFAKNERFGTWNAKSLGIILYSHTETELMKVRLAERQGNEPPPPPNTKLYRKRRKLRIRQIAATKEHKAVVQAVGRFMKELHRMNYDVDGIVSLPELQKVFMNSNEFTKADQQILFGDKDINEAFQELDRDEDGEITFQELMTFIESKGINIQTRFLGYSRKEIKTLADFISTLQTALSINVKRNYVEDRDIDRTIGIDTDYIEASDFYLEEADKEFLLESGARAARAYLRHYCIEHPEFRRRESAMLSKGFFESERRMRYRCGQTEEKEPVRKISLTVQPNCPSTTSKEILIPSPILPMNSPPVKKESGKPKKNYRLHDIAVLDRLDDRKFSDVSEIAVI